jgi:hypothetical protein
MGKKIRSGGAGHNRIQRKDMAMMDAGGKGTVVTLQIFRWELQFSARF